VAVVDAAVDGAEGAAGDDALDDELGGVDLPVLPPGAERVLPPADAALVGAGGGLLLALLHGPGAAEVALQLLVQALEVDLVRPDEPPVTSSAAAAAATPLLHRGPLRLIASRLDRAARCDGLMACGAVAPAVRLAMRWLGRRGKGGGGEAWERQACELI